MPLPTPDNMTFLVIDDMYDMRRTIRAMLKLIDNDAQVLEAENGRVAWEILASEDQPVHFIISDWNMPEMTGTQLLNRVRSDRRFRDIPFLMITAEANMEIVAEAAENEVDGYLTKPFVTATLEKKIHQLLESARNPDPLTVHLAKARDLEEQEDIDGAIAEAKLAMAYNERSSRPVRQLGRLYLKKKDLENAKCFFEKAIAINQLDVTSFHFLGQLHYRKGEIDTAINYFSRAMDISPRHVDRALKFASLLLQNKMLRQAERVFILVLRHYGDNQTFRQDIAEKCLQGGLLDLAIRIFRDSLRNAPDDLKLIRQVGIALRRKGQNREALPLLEQVAKENPHDIELLLEIAQGNLELKKLVPAERWAVKVIRLNPGNEKAMKILRSCD